MAEASAETGIDPRALLEDSAMLLTIVEVLQERAREARKRR